MVATTGPLSRRRRLAIRRRQREWAARYPSARLFALTQLRKAYLYPELIDTSVNPANFATVEAYIDALVAPA